VCTRERNAHRRRRPTDMKTVSVILAFHAHEPSWDLPRAVVETLRDDDVRRQAIGNEHWIRKRASAGRDVYAKLVELGRRLGAPVCLEATNELLMQVRRYMPATFARLSEAYRTGAVYPVYGNAFHTHIAMLSDAELADELRLNREYVHEVLGAPAPRHPGAFPMEGSIDARRLGGFQQAGMEYVIFPQLSGATTRYSFDGATPPDSDDPQYGPFTIGEGPAAADRLLALPRNFAISQEVWRPITRWKPDLLAPQGYILGKYHVLDEEYRADAPVTFPITRAEAAVAYAETLRQALRDAPDGGLLVYMQDLELMDFGEEALDILGEAWSAVRGEGIANVRFTTPDVFIDELRASAVKLPHLRFHQASWAPEIRLVLRSDGHYPPRHAGAFRGIDNDRDVFRRWPFIFWEPGRFISDTFKALIAPFGYALELSLNATALDAAMDDLASLDGGARVALHLRAMQRACNFGWQPDEARHEWPYLHGLAIAELLRERLREPAAAADIAAAWRPLPERALRGLDRVLEIFIDTRVAAMRSGTATLAIGAGEAEQHLANAERRRRRASALIRQVYAENMKFVTSCAIDVRAAQRVLALVQEHCKEGYLALNEIQRAWMCIDDTAAMLEATYAYLYEVYPPRFPAILREMLSAEEWALVEEPVLV
jgi:hypothetical protein